MLFEKACGRSVLVREIGDDTDGKKLKNKALWLAESGLTSSNVANVLNLKRQQVAAWKAWETMRAES